jgi:putative ABC transport system permease protein
LLAPNGSPDLTIVGIIANARNNGLRNEPAPVVLIPFTLLAPPQRILAVRTAVDPKTLLNPVREQVRGLDRDQPLGRPLTLDEVVGSDLVQPRFTMALFAFFAIFGLALAAAGLYSVLSFNVTRRTHEIGIRMALGARRADILNLMLTMGGRLVLVGVAVGVPASLLTSRLLQNLLFGVKPIDAPAYVAVALLLGVVALIASYLPARRAAGVDPMVALRHE